ncbi:hypothetical protein BC830DRAFT_1105532 [Chytriomyces sp. MP71]|nr:hypothetical protein BC830DRAFT_1105532 [Chytriomyces sp. MP71]
MSSSRGSQLYGNNHGREQGGRGSYRPGAGTGQSGSGSRPQTGRNPPPRSHHNGNNYAAPQLSTFSFNRPIHNQLNHQDRPNSTPANTTSNNKSNNNASNPVKFDVKSRAFSVNNASSTASTVFSRASQPKPHDHKTSTQQRYKASSSSTSIPKSVSTDSAYKDQLTRRAERFGINQNNETTSAAAKKKEPLFKPEPGSLETQKTSDDFISFADFDDGDNAAKAAASRKQPEWRRKEDGSVHDRDPLEIVFEFPQPVWKDESRGMYSKDLMRMFNQEVQDYVHYIAPTVAEHSIRHLTIERLRFIVNKLWPKAQMEVFGSFNTKLYLPTSDVDIVIMGSFLKPPKCLFELSVALRDHGLVSTIEVISKAKVPIIKYVDALTNFPVDISINMPGGMQAAQIVTQFLDEPNGVGEAIRGLMYILKQFLLTRHLNEPFNGGCGSYALLILVSTFVKLHPAIQMGMLDPAENLGILFIEFLEHYGKHFNYSDLGIMCDLETGPRYFSKYDYVPAMGRKHSYLTLLDPQDSTNDVGGGAFNFYAVKNEFNRCYNRLICVLGTSEHARLERHRTARHTRFTAAATHGGTDRPQSVLSAILSVRRGLFEMRASVEVLWADVRAGLVATGCEDGEWARVVEVLKRDAVERDERVRGVKRKRDAGDREVDAVAAATMEREDAARRRIVEEERFEKEFDETVKAAKEELGYDSAEDGELSMEISDGDDEGESGELASGEEGEEERKWDFKSPLKKRARV